MGGGHTSSWFRRFLFYGFGPPVNAHVINQHALWKYRGGVRIPWPVAANRQIKDQKEGLIENPLPSGFKITPCASHIDILIDVEADGLRIPLDGEDVEIVSEAPLSGKRAGKRAGKSVG